MFENRPIAVPPTPYKKSITLRCGACGRPYSSDRIQVGQEHKACLNSPAGKFVEDKTRRIQR